ncbi:MAG: hypothetical protein K2X48_00270 [Chitinophagaceae bacterium]|nr:hypothetical protein [Chitinophagaceae bacterium]
MEDTFAKVEELVGNLKEYAANRADEVKLNTAEKTAKLMSYLIAITIITAMVLFFILFMALALSVYLGQLLGGLQWGLLITGGLLLLLIFLLWVLRARVLQYPIMNALLRQLYNQQDEEDEQD